MMHAYDEIYLNDAMRNLGEAFDYSATVLAIPMDDFLDMFIISGIAEQFCTRCSKVCVGSFWNRTCMGGFESYKEKRGFTFTTD